LAQSVVEIPGAALKGASFDPAFLAPAKVQELRGDIAEADSW